MKEYKVTITTVASWSIELVADNKDEAQKIAEDMALDDIEDHGNFEELVSVDVTDVEEIHREDEDD